MHVLPESVPRGRAVLAANLETAINGVWDAAARPAIAWSSSAVAPSGCLVAWLASRIPGCDVELVDVNPVVAMSHGHWVCGFTNPIGWRTARMS